MYGLVSIWIPKSRHHRNTNTGASNETGLHYLGLDLILIRPWGNARSPIMLRRVLINPAPGIGPDRLPSHDTTSNGPRSGLEGPRLVGSSSLEGVVADQLVRWIEGPRRILAVGGPGFRCPPARGKETWPGRMILFSPSMPVRSQLAGEHLRIRAGRFAVVESAASDLCPVQGKFPRVTGVRGNFPWCRP